MKKFKILLYFTLFFLIATNCFAQKDLLKVRIADFSGGVNTYDLADVINANQGTVMKNAVPTRKGRLFKRKGQRLFVDDISDTAFTGVGTFSPDIYSDYILAASGEYVIKTDNSEASWERVNIGYELAYGNDTEFVQANNFLHVLNGVNYPPDYDGVTWTENTGATSSPPIAKTGAWLRNYLFLAGNSDHPDWVYFSNNLNSRNFTSTDIVKVNTGDGQRIVKLEPYRLFELIVYKEKSIFNLDITGSFDDGDWTVQPISTSVGCAAPRTVVSIGNDHLFLSSEPYAIRSLVRTSYDKILLDMISQPIQDIFDSTAASPINVTRISQSCATLFDNKYYLAIPVGSSTVNNQVLVFDFVTKAWHTIDGWYPAQWFVFKDKLHYIDAKDGRAIRCLQDVVGDLVAGPITTVSSASAETVGVRFEYVSKYIDFDNPENYKMPDALEVEFGPSGNYTATVYIRLDEEAWQIVGTVNLAADSATLPVSLPFNLGPRGIVRQTFHLQQYGEFRKMQVKIVQGGKYQTCDLHRICLFARMRPWRRE